MLPVARCCNRMPCEQSCLNAAKCLESVALGEKRNDRHL